MAFSTECVIRRAWRFEDIGEKLVRSLRHCTQDDATRTLAHVRSLHADADWLTRHLDELPAPSLCVLATLADADGFLEEPELFARTRSQFQIGPAETGLAITALLDHLLVVPLSLGGGGQAVALVASIADSVVAKLADLANLDGLALPDDAFVAVPRVHGVRSLLAVAAGLRHFELKCSINGTANKGGLKRLSASLGMVPAELETLVYRAEALGLVRIDEQSMFRPDPTALASAAAATYAHDPILATLRRELGTHVRPMSEAQIDRWLTRCADRARQAHDIPVWSSSFNLVKAATLAFAPGFEAGTVGGKPALRAIADPGRAASAITPSFEVFVPPEARWCDIVDLLAAAELVRVDQVIVARLTKVSVQRALRAELDCPELLARLAAACRTPVPQNVEATIRDWAAGSMQATVVFGRTIVVPASETDRARAALAKLSPRTLAPGVLVVDARTQPRAIELALASIGILVADDAARPPAKVGAARAKERGTTVAYPPLMVSPADARYAQRILAYQRGDRGERAKLAPAPSRRELEASGGAMVSAIQRVLNELKIWERRMRVRLPDAEVMSFAMALTEQDEAGLRHVFAARTVPELRTRAAACGDDGGAGETRGARAGGARGAGGTGGAGGARETPGAGGAPDAGGVAARSPVAWVYEHLQARLEAAAKVRAAMLVLAGDEEIELVVSRVSRRGREWVVLGEQLDGTGIALSLSEIRAVADPDPPPASVARERWVVPAGASAPAGHLPCPCGSGQKYRACCRAN